MAKVKYISSPSEIPAGEKYVLVMYGEEYAQTTHPLGLNITVACTVSAAISGQRSDSPKTAIRFQIT